MNKLWETSHKLGDTYRSVVNTFTSVSTESKFLENGTLTPEEFVQAGEQLAFKFPTWKWEAGDASRQVSFLPKDKQYLITRNVPCKDRVRALDFMLEHNTECQDDWLVPDVRTGAAGPSNEVRDLDDLPEDGVGGIGSTDDGDGASGGIIIANEDFIKAPSSKGGYPGGSDIPDFNDLDKLLAEDDPGAVGSSSGCIVADAPDEQFIRTRSYDLSITYDKYYQTPRLWLFGYNEGGQPLKPDEIYEDVLSEYISKTVTVDPHPLTGIPTVSIHPCKHASVMKKVVADWIAQDVKPRVDHALFVFLKFISSVVPTINYDFTMDIEL